MSIQRRIYEQLAGLNESEVEDKKDLRVRTPDFKRKAELDRRNREREQRMQTNGYEPEGEEIEEIASKVYGAVKKVGSAYGKAMDKLDKKLNSPNDAKTKLGRYILKKMQ